MEDLTSLTPAELSALMAGVPAHSSSARGHAVWRWLREQRGIPVSWPLTLPSAGKRALHSLQQQVKLPAVNPLAEVVAADGTVKWSLTVSGHPVEAVLIPNPSRSTVCISSQSGCTRSCEFCATAKMGFVSQLSAGEMVAQVMLARARAPQHAPVTNVVFMGMGEPMDNLAQVLRAVHVLEEGMALGPRHVTVSTSGVLPGMERFCRESRACLALSLHATTDELRTRLMPRVARWNLDSLTSFMRAESARTPRHFFIEYILMAGVNDAEQDADRLVALLKGVRARVNLIPYNSISSGPFTRPAPERVRAFQARVVAAGQLCLTRQPRGEDASAACGQLVALTRSVTAPAPPR